jgi:hypothetical protein
MHSNFKLEWVKHRERRSILIREWYNLAQNDGRELCNVYASEAKKSEFLVDLDRFSKYLKYIRNFEKRFKWTRNSDFFASTFDFLTNHHNLSTKVNKEHARNFDKPKN